LRFVAGHSLGREKPVNADLLPAFLAFPVSSPEGKAAGLRLDSVVMTDNLATIMESEIDSILGHLPDITKANAALRHTLGI
jgi:mRNA interferase MazF